MDKLSLNFFGEQVEVKLPETLASLRQSISDKFLFSPSDTAELVISYVKDLGKKIIETENDFKEFIKTKIFKVDLDVDPNSQIFKKSLVKLQTEKEEDKKELDNLLSKSKELKEEKKQKISEAKKKMDELSEKKKEMEKKKKEAIAKFDREIKKIKNEISKIKKQSDSEKQKISQKEDELNKSIDEIKTKLGIPVEKKEKKEKKPKLKTHLKSKPKLRSKREVKNPFFNKLKDNLDKISNKVSDTIKNQLENNNLPENQKNLLKTIKDWSDYVKNNTQEITNNLSKKYDEYKNLLIPETNKEIHWSYICDGCNMAPIKGVRYHCKECDDFDFCEKCHAEKKDEHKHNFLAVEKSVYKPPERKLRAPRFAGGLKFLHQGVTCDGCGVYPIAGCRYKCAICPNFDFCENCEKKLAKEHSHPMVQIPDPNMKLYSIQCALKEEYKMKNDNEHIDIIHDGICCDGCGCKCIVGSRYKCAVCPNFDYCEKCLKEHTCDHQHPFIKIYHPKMKLASIKVVVDENCPTYDLSNSAKVKEQREKEEEIKEEKKEEIKEEKKEEKKEETPIEKKEEGKPVHEGISCDGCGAKNIVGCRYKCAVCHNFDYCEECEEKLSDKHLHPFIKIYNPEMKIASIKCVVRDDCPIYEKEQ